MPNTVSNLIGGGKVQQLAEVVGAYATAANTTVHFDVISQGVLLYTTAATANWTLNLRGNSSVTLNSLLSTGQAATVAHIVTTGTTAYYASTIQVDSTTTNVTTKWQGGSAPTSGNASSLDTYSFTVIKTAATTYTVLASQTQFK